MGVQTWQEVLTQSVTDGPAIAATITRTSCIPTANSITLPNNYFYLGRVIRFTLSGRISCAVTPNSGTARFDICMGSGGTTIVYDTGAVNLNAVAKTNVPWKLEVDLICRTVGAGTSTTFFPIGIFQSEAIVGSPLTTVGGNGSLIVPVTAPAVGAGTDNTIAAELDVFFTQTSNNAGNSVTVHNYRVEVLN